MKTCETLFSTDTGSKNEGCFLSEMEFLNSPVQSPDGGHFETVHYSKEWRLGMQFETDLGIMPDMWSVSSAMNDPRPNGRSIFDARFSDHSVGRARGGRAMVWDSRGTVDSMKVLDKDGDGKLSAKEMRAENFDLAMEMMKQADARQDAFEDAGLNMGSAHMAGGRFYNQHDQSYKAELKLAAGSGLSDKY